MLMLPDFARADAIGSYYGNPATRTIAELLIDCEEDRTLPGGSRRDAARGRDASRIARSVRTRWLRTRATAFG
ncbi:MAG: hypothetical protein WB297_18385 [Actinomycetota bacterium]